MARYKSDTAIAESVVSRDPEVLGGTPVFAGTRVPVRYLFEHLAAGHALDDFRAGYPRVTREQITDLLARLADLIERQDLRL